MRSIPAGLVESIERRLRERRVHGVALAAFDADGIRFGGGVGFADLSRGEEVSANTVFRVASVSKLLTTTVVLNAVGAGLLDLDQPVNELLPEAQQILGIDGEEAADFPLRTLLSHTSGLPSSLGGTTFPNPALTRLTNGVVPHSLAEAITGLQVVRPPGERIVYANSGMNVAGFLAGQARGVAFEEAATTQVFGPLGMERSQFSTDRSGPGVATPYGSLLPPGVSSKSAAGMQLVATPMGGLTTTVEDLSRFGRMVLGGGQLDGQRILDEDLVAQATTLTTRNHPELEQGYGMGFKVRPWRGHRIAGHDGHMPGVATQVWLAPDDGVGVAVLTNGFALGIPHEVALLALAELLGPSETAAGEDADGAIDVAAAERFADEAEGRYVAEGFTPPGVVGTLAKLTTRVRLIHEARGLIRVEGNPGADGAMWLRPTAEPGRYRVSAAVDDDSNAVFEARPDGLHLWAGHGVLLRRPA